jgi:Zn-dependent protease
MTDFANIPLQLAVLFFSVIVHEVAHGKAALWCGDSTARDAGRLTFNPLPHVDLVGSILLPLMLAVTRSPVMLGWAKPVPINPMRFRNTKRDLAIVGAAGPLSNLGLAVLAAAAFKVLAPMLGSENPVLYLFLYGAVINIVLMVFNLIPVPPLDGSRILTGLLPDRMAARYLGFERFGFLLIFALLFFGLDKWLISPLVNLILRILL